MQGPYHGDPKLGFTYEWDVQLSKRGTEYFKARGFNNAEANGYVNIRPDGFKSH